jgi:hypothetical protein
MIMNEDKKTSVAAVDDSSSGEQEQIEDKVCQGVWKLKSDVVLREEEDGAILFDPDTGGVGTINVTGSALLRWRPGRICHEEWCKALSTHYKETDVDQIQSDVKRFLVGISRFLEAQ